MLILDKGKISKYHKDTTQQTTLEEATETIRKGSIRMFEEWRKNNERDQPSIGQQNVKVKRIL